MEQEIASQLLNADYIPATSPDQFEGHFKPIHKDTSTTNLQLALAVQAFICKHCTGSKKPLKDLLKLMQICLPPENNFVKTLTQFEKVHYYIMI